MKRKISVLLACLMLVNALPVLAAGQNFAFSFTSKNQLRSSASYAKEDNEQNAYVTIIESDTENFVDNVDVFGCRVRRSSNNAAVTNYTLLTTTSNYQLPYITTGYQGVEYYLRGQIDDTSVYSALEVEGRWLP